MSGRKRTELSEEQKNQVQELVKQGKGMDQISKEIHVHFSKLKEYLDSTEILTNTKVGRPKSATPKPVKPKVVVEHHEPKYLEQPMPIISSDYDLTLYSYEEDQKFADELMVELMYKYKIEIHKEIELGGIFLPYGGFEQSRGAKMYPIEKHVFDLYIPEINLIIIPNFITAENQEKWKHKIGNQLRPNALHENEYYIQFLMCGYWNNFDTKKDFINLNTNDYNKTAIYIKKFF